MDIPLILHPHVKYLINLDYIFLICNIKYAMKYSAFLQFTRLMHLLRKVLGRMSDPCNLELRSADYNGSPHNIEKAASNDVAFLLQNVPSQQII